MYNHVYVIYKFLSKKQGLDHDNKRKIFRKIK